MKLWLISQQQNNNYDTFDSAVVAAETGEAARQIHPHGQDKWNRPLWKTWCDKPAQVQVEYIGECREDMAAGVVLASFNAG